MALNKKLDQEKNPRNDESALFRRLTRLFSGPITDRRRQTYSLQKKRRLDKYKSRFKSASGQSFKKSEYSPFENLQAEAINNQNRGERYIDFEQMEYDPIINSALDIYADEMTTHTAIEQMLKIDCPNEEIKGILDNLYTKVLNVDFNLFGWCRTMCKYGDHFLYLDIDEEEGIQSVIGIPTHEIERMEGQDSTNPNYVKYQWNSAGMTFEEWQVAHFRILGNEKYAPYGTSVLEAARRIWRMLTLIEDAMMAYRIVRSPERRVFTVDVGAVAPEDVEQHMLHVMTSMKKNQVLNADTGRVDLRYNPMSVEEDYFIPSRGGLSQTKIESLPGGQYVGDIDDVKYLRDKLFSALKIPQSYLSRGEGGDEDKTTLAQKDIRFARTVQRLQRAVIAELEKIGIIHLYVLGFRDEDLISHKLSLNNPSKIAELQDLEHWRTKFDVAASATEGFFSKRWVAKNIFDLSDEDFLRNQRDMFSDAKFQGELDKVSAEASEMSGESGGLGGMGDALGGGLDALGGEEMDIGDEETGGEASGGEAGGSDEADDGPLLAAPPGKRDDSRPREKYGTTTAKSKGKIYRPVKDDRRDMAARKKNQKSKYGAEKASGSRRNVMGAGSQEMFSLGKGIYESADDIYNEYEKGIIEESKKEEKLIQVTTEVKTLLSKLKESKIRDNSNKVEDNSLVESRDNEDKTQ